MIKHILVVLTTDEAIPRSYYGSTQLVHVDNMSEEAIFNQLKIETESCLLTALEEVE